MSCTRLDEALHAIASARKTKDLKSSIVHVRDIHGVSHIAYIGLRIPNLIDSDPYLILTYPDEWVDRYRRENFFLIDPFLIACRSGLLPVDWSTISPSPESDRVIALAAQYRIGKAGMSLPIRGPDGDISVFSFTTNLAAGHWEAFKRETLSEMTLIGMHFHARVVQLLAQQCHAKLRPTLTARERECLQLLSGGDPPKKIATTLTLSEATVRLYLKRARARLGAGTLMQAVVIALRANLIAPP